MFRHVMFVLYGMPLAALSTALSLLAGACAAGEEEMDALFARLQDADAAEAGEIEEQIWRLWSDSGSPSMNLLLESGRKAMAARHHAFAIRQLNALVEHAPEFAEGWNARATAWYLTGEYDRSIEDILRTLELNPRHFGAMSGFAMIMERYGDPLAALQSNREIEKIHPNRTGLGETIRRLERELSDKRI